MLEELLATGSSQIVMTQSRGIAILQEREVVREAGLLDVGGVVAELGNETGNEGKLGGKGVPRSMTNHLKVRHPRRAMEQWSKNNE